MELAASVIVVSVVGYMVCCFIGYAVGRLRGRALDPAVATERDGRRARRLSQSAIVAGAALLGAFTLLLIYRD